MAGEGVVPDIAVPLKSWVDLVLAFGADFFAFIVVAALIAAFAFYFGGDRLPPLIAGIYAAIPLYLAFPFRALLPGTPFISVGIFVAFTAAAMIAFLGLSFFSEHAVTSFLRVFAISVAAAGLLLAIAINVLPVEELYTFSAPTKALFAGDIAYFWWLAAPIAALFFFGRG